MFTYIRHLIDAFLHLNSRYRNGQGQCAQGTGALNGLRMLTLYEIVAEAELLRNVTVDPPASRLIPVTHKEGIQQYACDSMGRVWLLSGFSSKIIAETWLAFLRRVVDL